MNENNLSEIRNLHLIECKYVGPTATRCSKVKLTSHRYGDSIGASFDHEFRDSSEQGLKILQNLGFEVLFRGESRNAKTGQDISTFFAVSNFVSLKDMEKGKNRTGLAIS